MFSLFTERDEQLGLKLFYENSSVEKVKLTVDEFYLHHTTGAVYWSKFT